MSLNGGWISFGGDARIELAVGLLAAAGGVTYAGVRLRHPVRAVRPATSVVVLMFSLWALALVAFAVGLAIYVHQLVRDYPHYTPGVTDPITPVTFLAAAVIFCIILTRAGWPFPARLGSAAVAAMAAPMIFELPFDIIVMARTYPGLSPDPALYRAVFFTPLFLIELTTLCLLTLSPMVRLRKSTFFCLALMFCVFAAWALSGFGYPQSALPITMNVVSKILAFITALTLFLPGRLRDWPTDGPAPASGEQIVPPAVPATAGPVMAAPAGPVVAGPVMAGPVMAAPAPAVPYANAPAGHVGSTPTRTLPTKTPPTRTPQPAREAIMGAPAIKVLGLRKSFGEKAAVAGIDLEIEAGSSPAWSGRTGPGRLPPCR